MGALNFYGNWAWLEMIRPLHAGILELTGHLRVHFWGGSAQVVSMAKWPRELIDPAFWQAKSMGSIQLGLAQIIKTEKTIDISLDKGNGLLKLMIKK